MRWTVEVMKIANARAHAAERGQGASGLIHPRFKITLWASLGLIVLFVFITSEVLLIADYPMYHAYRLQVIADRHLLIPHTVGGTLALVIGPLNFSSRLRQRQIRLHRILGRLRIALSPWRAGNANRRHEFAATCRASPAQLADSSLLYSQLRAPFGRGCGCPRC